ncbi:MAG: acylneuraminate cytidylyltransferase family protein [Magnetococcus sp. YQC-3]
MLAGEAVLAIVPARGGSKGLPGKNVRLLHDKPLLAWTLQAAQACPLLDRTILSSDDEEIMAVARRFGCAVPFVRPGHLANDTASSMEVILHALDSLPEHYPWVVLLQPTSPLRRAEDISACLEMCQREGAPACVTVTPTKSPSWCYFLDGDQRMVPVLGQDNTRVGRQQLPSAYALNGAVYVARSDWLRERRTFVTGETRAHLMPAERSVDIDTLFDFQWAEWLLRGGGLACRPESAR